MLLGRSHSTERRDLPLTAGERRAIVVASESAFVKLAHLYEELLPIFARYGFKPQSAGVVSRDLRVWLTNTSLRVLFMLSPVLVLLACGDSGQSSSPTSPSPTEARWTLSGTVSHGWADPQTSGFDDSLRTVVRPRSLHPPVTSLVPSSAAA